MDTLDLAPLVRIKSLVDFNFEMPEYCFKKCGYLLSQNININNRENDKCLLFDEELITKPDEYPLRSQYCIKFKK